VLTPNKLEADTLEAARALATHRLARVRRGGPACCDRSWWSGLTRTSEADGGASTEALRAAERGT
jgi:hypothetical protein